MNVKSLILRMLWTVSLGALLLAPLSLTAQAAETDRYIYVASTGSDQNTGETPETPVKSLNKANLIAIQSGAERVIFVITDACTLENAHTELVHKMPFVYTTNDGKTDYGAAGAKLRFGKGLRFSLNGDTTFENIAIEYSGTLNFVAQYNPITFGKGVTLTRPEGGSGAYIVGGWQAPAASKAVDRDSHITVESGLFNVVVGGSRQGTTELTFTGTHYITVNGGQIDKFYAGSLSNHKNQNVDITVNGGKVHTLYVNGDEDRVLNGTATLRLLGGEAAYVYINNVLQDVNVSLLGAKVEEMKVAYTTTSLRTLQQQANRPKTLTYSAHAYAAEKIASFIGFTVLANETTLYAKQGAKGDGLSESTPASFADAMQTAAKIGGKVKIIGKVRLDTYSEPVHSEKITITGASSDAQLEIAGEYKLSGNTCFAELTLAGKGTVNATNGIFETAESIKLASGCDLLLRGSAVLGGGNFSEIREAKTVQICGGVVDKITGGSTETHVEVTSGRVGTLRTTDTEIKSFVLTMIGGSIDKVVFCNVTDKLVYRVLGGKVSAYAVEGKNVQGAISAEDPKFSMQSLGAAAALFTESNTAVFFLSGGGTGSGKSAYDASASLKDAYAFLAETGGTIVVSGPYTLTTATNFRHEKPIVITSLYDGVDYAKRNGAELIFGTNFYCGGDTEFRDITLVANGKHISILGNCYKLVMGENITSRKDQGSDTYLSVMGGGNSVVTNCSTDLVIKSGTWQRVRGGAAANGSQNLNVHLTIEGGEFREMLTLGSSGSHSGDIHAVIRGGTFLPGIYASTLTSETNYFDSNVSLVIEGGTFYGNIAPANSKLGTYSGTYTVTLSGGDFSHVVDIAGTAGLGSMTSALQAGPETDLGAAITGTQSFTSLARYSGADPWLFYHDGYFYFIATAGGSGLQLVKVANLGDLSTASSARIYKPEKGHEYSSHIWSPEIHYFSAEEIGEEYAGWYCFIASAPDETWEKANNVHDDSTFGALKGYVIKCLTDDLLGPWGHPITGEPNVPQKLEFPDSGDNEETGVMGCSVITINGTKYLLFIDSVGKETQKTNSFNYHQRINIVKFSNPWTIEGHPKVICVPEYDWEKKGSEDKYHPAVVEGATAVYNPNGEVYIIYSGSGYWTAHYQLGQLTYIGGPNGDPTDVKNWYKKPTSIFSQSDELRGCGHASYVTDTDGQGWICYHAYPKGLDSRSAYMEPYYFTDTGVVIGDGSGHPAKLDTVYTTNLNPLPIGERISGFDSITESGAVSVTLKMTLGKTEYTVNGAKKTMDVAPIIRNDRTMLPVRYVAETLGAEILWDGATSTATLKTADTEIKITVGAAEAIVNGQTVKLDSPAFIENSRTYMPVRFVAETLGATVAWDGATSTATITK